MDGWSLGEVGVFEFGAGALLGVDVTLDFRDELSKLKNMNIEFEKTWADGNLNYCPNSL